ncbi:MAG: tRNA pseudouridine(38-40) synthase TruA [Actinobacteria bacterium]|nr:tRNA pseudouridine(38-40) synthase TruA [Actinomycetota bacterium]
MRNIKLILEYLGTNYAGFQKQPELTTIQGKLEEILSIFLREEIKVIGSGRTDAGVHAAGQVVNFKTNSDVTIRRLWWSVNGMLPYDIKIIKAEDVDESFNARRDAVSRIYRYYILNRNYPSVFKKDFVYFFARPLNLEKIKETLGCFIGKHDFSSFCRIDLKRSSVRNVKRFECSLEDDFIIFEIEADSFLHSMVRTIVGMLIEAGLGRVDPEEVKNVLNSKGKIKGGPVAPSVGLVLWEVKYKNVKRKT